MARLKAIDIVLAETLAAHPPRAGSLIITVFGDSISQHGNKVWLGSLIHALEPFGLNARQIRTAVFRLAQDGWLSCIKIGRRSYYSFTEFGLAQYARSARRIYLANPSDWDGLWTLVIPAFASVELRERLKRELSWLGFGSIANGVLAHPCANQESLSETLLELDAAKIAVVLRASTDQVASREVLKRLTRESWQLDELESRYASFIERFGALQDPLAHEECLEPAQMFEIQTILIHEYRRILLKTTDLPNELLPAGWSGRAAMDLIARLYHLVRESTARYLESTLETSQGQLPKANNIYFDRFT